jgi:hypothetical protein
MDVTEIRCCDMDCSRPAEDSDQWQALMHMVMKPRIQ